MKNKPHYAIASVDHALQLAQLLQQEGSLRVTDAAERLGVSGSTAHRLLAMLVYRDFAEQDADRRYAAGPALRPVLVSEAPTRLLRRVALPHLRALVGRVDESVNLMVLVGTEVRFVATVECDRPLRAGDRVGRVLPAHLTSGGKALLAAMPPAVVADLYRGTEEWIRLRRELNLTRTRGFAINDQRTEAGLTALGTALLDRTGVPTAALSLALPTARFDRDEVPQWVGALRGCAALIERDLAAAEGDGGGSLPDPVDSVAREH